MVQKAVILAGGTGTRFLPYTKCHPKEMLAVIDKPAMQILVEEVVSSGISQILIVLSQQKSDIVNFFTPNAQLYDYLQSKNLVEYCQILQQVEGMAQLTFAFQPTPNGTGQALLMAKEWSQNQPIAVLCGDDVIFGKVPATKQLIDCYNNVACSVVGVQPVETKQISKYASVDVASATKLTQKVRAIVEKPHPNVAPSNLASLGRYVFSPQIFDCIQQTDFVNGERRLTDAMQLLAQQGKLYSHCFVGNRFDFGDKFGYLQGVTYAGLSDSRFSTQYRQFLTQLLENN